MLRRNLPSLFLALGDGFCVLVVTLAGFAFHRELEGAAAARFPATLVPFLAAWWLAAYLAGAYVEGPNRRWARTFRAIGSAVLAAPLGAIVRGAWLGTAVVPIFVLVMGSMVAGLILLWRIVAESVLVRRLTSPSS